jgi:hypothetical protein
MDEYIESLKNYYEKKSKLKKAKSKSKHTTSEIIEIERIPYYYNKEYLRTLEDKISDEKNKMLMIKYNILYNLIDDEDSVEKFDTIEENIKILKEERDKIKFKIQRKEERKMKKLKDLNDRINIMKYNYKEIPEDRKITYLEIQEIRDQINDIMNNDRCILDDSQLKVYRVINDYEPIRDNEITEHTESINEPSEKAETKAETKADIETQGKPKLKLKSKPFKLDVETLD